MDPLSTAVTLTASCRTTLSPAPCWTLETDGLPAGSCLSMQCSLAWDPNQTPRKKVSRTLLEARRVGHQFPEGSNSFNAGWPREGLLRDRQIHLELFCMCLCLDMSQIIREKCGHRIWKQGPGLAVCGPGCWASGRASMPLCCCVFLFGYPGLLWPASLSSARSFLHRVHLRCASIELEVDLQGQSRS